MGNEKRERELSERLKAHLRAHMVKWKVSEAKLAEDWDEHQSTINRIMRNKDRAVPLWMIDRIKALGFTWQDLFDTAPAPEFHSQACLSEVKYTRKTGADEPTQNPVGAPGSSQLRGQQKKAAR